MVRGHICFLFLSMLALLSCMVIYQKNHVLYRASWDNIKYQQLGIAKVRFRSSKISESQSGVNDVHKQFTDSATLIRQQLDVAYKHPDNVTRMESFLKIASNFFEALAIKDKYKSTFSLITEPHEAVQIRKSMPLEEAYSLFFKFVSRKQITCEKIVTIGNKHKDGGWHVCLTPPYALTKPCLVYSIGMGREWSFDFDVTENYGCTDMAFDPTIKKKSYKPNELMWFHDIGLGGDNMLDTRNWTMKTLTKIYEMLGHTQNGLDLLKVDVEFCEWHAIEKMLFDGSLLKVKQFVFEFHTNYLKKVGGSATSYDYSYYWLIFKGLETIGFKQFYYKSNSCCWRNGRSIRCCGLVHYINTRFIS